MQIKGIAGVPPDQLKFEVQQGGRFIIYQYCVSAVLVTWRESTDIYFVRAGESRIMKGLPWAILTLFAGWWGIPWGPIYSISALWKDLRGGDDVTAEILLQLELGYVDLAPQPVHG